MKTAISTLCLVLCFSIFSLGFASPDFSGNWIQDAENSNTTGAPDGFVVRQSDIRLDVESIWSQPPSTQGSQNEQFKEVKTPFGSILRRDAKEEKNFSYILDGNEHSITNENGNSKTYRVTLSGNQLVIESLSTIKTPFGPAEIRVKEEWSLSVDGRTLIITTTTTSAAGTQIQKRIFTKQV